MIDNDTGGTEDADDLLANYRVFDTGDADEIRDTACSLMGAKRVVMPDTEVFRARASYVPLRQVELLQGLCNCDVVVDYPEMDRYRISFSLVGTIRMTSADGHADINPDQLCIIAPNREFSMHGQSGSTGLNWLAVRIRTEALAERQIALAFHNSSELFSFDTVAAMKDGRVQTLYRCLRALTTELNETDHPNPVLVDLLQDAIVTGFLRLSPAYYSSDGIRADRLVAKVRLASDYIEANWHRHVPLGELVAITETSARTLHRAFEKTMGCSPIAFAKKSRLRRARSFLLEPLPATSVSATAFRCGFSNLGHFARDYRLEFGELPSDTLARRRGPETETP